MKKTDLVHLPEAVKAFFSLKTTIETVATCLLLDYEEHNKSSDVLQVYCKSLGTTTKLVSVLLRIGQGDLIPEAFIAPPRTVLAVTGLSLKDQRKVLLDKVAIYSPSDDSCRMIDCRTSSLGDLHTVINSAACNLRSMPEQKDYITNLLLQAKPKVVRHTKPTLAETIAADKGKAAKPATKTQLLVQLRDKNPTAADIAKLGDLSVLMAAVQIAVTKAAKAV